MICLHGTTDKGLNAILNSDGYKPSSPWTCSDNDGATYVWPLNKLIEVHGYDDDADIEDLLHHAFESAQIQAVFTQCKNLYVLVLDIPDEFLSDDYSCENMADTSSYINQNNFSKEMIVDCYACDFNKWLSPFVIKGLLHNDYFNKWEIDPMLLLVAESMNDENYIDSEFDFRRYEVN